MYDPKKLAQAVLDKHLAAEELGELGGKKGGPARARALSRKRRLDIAREAADKRWHPGMNRKP